MFFSFSGRFCWLDNTQFPRLTYLEIQKRQKWVKVLTIYIVHACIERHLITGCSIRKCEEKKQKKEKRKVKKEQLKKVWKRPVWYISKYIFFLFRLCACDFSAKYQRHTCSFEMCPRMFLSSLIIRMFNILTATVIQSSMNGIWLLEAWVTLDTL